MMMDMEIIEEEKKEYYLVFADAHGDGYWFPCDPTGAIRWDKCPSPETTKDSLEKAKARQDWVKAGDVVTLIRHNRYGICPRCGRRVYVAGSGVAPYMGMVECECGQWYNVFGQAMRPPVDWEGEYN